MRWGSQPLGCAGNCPIDDFIVSAEPVTRQQQQIVWIGTHWTFVGWLMVQLGRCRDGEVAAENQEH
jgi:hypothetical protein